MDTSQLHWMVFTAVTVFAIFDCSSCHILYTEPLEVEVLVSQQFQLICSAETGVKSSDLKLKFIFKNGSELEIPEGNFETLNDSAIQLSHHGLSSEFDGCYISCYTTNNESVTTLVHIKERHPIPRITNYEYWNWEELRFDWEVKNSSRTLETEFRGWYKDSSAQDFTECPIGSRPNECIVHKKHYEIAPSASVVHIKVNGTNRLENISMDGILFRLHDYIRPGRLKSLVVKHALDEDHSSCYVFIRAPKKQSITYYISVICNNGSFKLLKNETPVDFSQIQTEISIKLTGLPPDSDCNVSVRTQPSQGGYWGPTESTSFRTRESVPLATPGICKSCFHLQKANANLQNAVIYFKPLSRELAQGKVTGYKVQYTDKNTRRTQFLESNSSVIQLQNLSSEVDYRITIEAKTSIGFNESMPIPILLLGRADHIAFGIERFVVTAKNMTVQMSWDQLEGASSYTSFWCEESESDDGICSGVLNWAELTSNYSYYEISLDAKVELSKYKFGVGATRQGHSSGILWTKFVYNMDAVALPPMIEVNTTKQTELFLRLTRQEPIAKFSGFVTKYVIYFCPVLSDDNPKCTAVMRRVTIDRWSNDAHLTDLLSGQLYLILGESWTAAGPSTHNTTLLQMTSPGEILAVWLVVLIVLGSLVCLAVVVVGIYTLIRFYRRSMVRCKQWLSIGVIPPPGRSADTGLAGCKAESNMGSGYSAATAAADSAAAVIGDDCPTTEIEIKNDGDKIINSREQLQISISPVKRWNDLANIPLFSEERLLPPIGDLGIHGSSPSVMLHVNKPDPSPKLQRILPSTRAKPAFVRPLRQQGADGVPSELIPMTHAAEAENHDPSDTESSMSYAYVRQHRKSVEFMEMPLSEAEPVTFHESTDDCKVFVGRNDDDDNLEKDVCEAEEKIFTVVRVDDLCRSDKMLDFEHLPPLKTELC